MDSRLLRDLYDIAEYYNRQLELLDFQSYNGLSNSHKKSHTTTTKDAFLLWQIMRIDKSHPHLVSAKFHRSIDGALKTIDLLINSTHDLVKEEADLVEVYQISLVVEHTDTDHGIRLKFTLTKKEQNNIWVRDSIYH